MVILLSVNNLNVRGVLLYLVLMFLMRVMFLGLLSAQLDFLRTCCWVCDSFDELVCY